MLKIRNQLTLYKRKFVLYSLYKQNLFSVLTSPIRILPDFIIIGAMRSGTSVLYNYIVTHPFIFPALRKEINFFSTLHYLGTNWYKSNFTLKFTKFIECKIKRKKFVTGESTPYYLFHPLSARRIHDLLPNIKLIVILRNPIDRAYSHYHVIKNSRDARKPEKLSFDDAIKEEKKRLENEREKIISNPNYESPTHRRFSYISRGLYVDQLEEWMNFFPRNQFLILTNEDLDSKPIETCNKIFEFLGLPHYEINVLKKNAGKYEKMKEQTRKFLVEYFKPYNARLSKFLGRDLNWDK